MMRVQTLFTQGSLLRASFSASSPKKRKSEAKSDLALLCQSGNTPLHFVGTATCLPPSLPPCWGLMLASRAGGSETLQSDHGGHTRVTVELTKVVSKVQD